MLKFMHESRTGVPESGSPTLRSVLNDMVGQRGEWRMILELDGDNDFSRNTWYVDVVKFWMSSDMGTAKIWPQHLWLEDFPKVGQKSSVRAAMNTSYKLSVAVLLHNGRVGFRIPVTLGEGKETVLDAALAAHFADQALPLNILDANLEEWVKCKRSPLRLER